MLLLLFAIFVVRWCRLSLFVVCYVVESCVPSFVVARCLLFVVFWLRVVIRCLSWFVGVCCFV